VTWIIAGSQTEAIASNIMTAYRLLLRADLRRLYGSVMSRFPSDVLTAPPVRNPYPPVEHVNPDGV
jgi:hypothetical protein